MRKPKNRNLRKQTQTMTPPEMTALITQGTPRYKKCSQPTLSVDIS